MAKKTHKLNLSDIIDKIISENRRHAYGHQEIGGLYDDLGQDDDVYLSDNTGDLRGEVVTKKEYLRNMLKDAINKQEWGIVHRAISYIDIKM